jgi:putative modified peptide
MAHDLDEDQIETLLERLSGDKAFHAAFAADPAAALASIGLPTGLAACMEGRSLASMEAIAGARAQVAALLSDAKSMTQHVHDLAAN